MKKLCNNALLLLILCWHSVGLALPAMEDFTHIECTLNPIAQSTEDKITYPHLPIKDGTSLNWSGYAAATSLSHPIVHIVNEVYGTWTVPQLSAASHTTYCSIWVGIDGYNSGTVEQIGTGHDWVNGRQQNYAWFEMYPQYPYEIVGFPVNVGDSISGLVQYICANTFLMIIYNNTQRVYTIIPTSYTQSTQALRSSAEWIVEAPYENGVLPLSHFGTVFFSNCIAKFNGVIGPINFHSWANDALNMALSNGTPKAIPTRLSSNGQNFSVTWHHE